MRKLAFVLTLTLLSATAWARVETCVSHIDRFGTSQKIFLSCDNGYGQRLQFEASESEYENTSAGIAAYRARMVSWLVGLGFTLHGENVFVRNCQTGCRAMPR